MTYAEQIQVATDFIEDRLDERFDLRKVSGAACISHAHFQRIFKAGTGETLKAYVRSRRLANSLELLATTDLRVLDIAVAAGFDAQESFARAFKQAFGLTPSEYRSIGRRNLFPEKLRIDDAYLANLQAMAPEATIAGWGTSLS